MWTLHGAQYAAALVYVCVCLFYLLLRIENQVKHTAVYSLYVSFLVQFILFCSERFKNDHLCVSFRWRLNSLCIVTSPFHSLQTGVCGDQSQTQMRIDKPNWCCVLAHTITDPKVIKLTDCTIYRIHNVCILFDSNFCQKKNELNQN